MKIIKKSIEKDSSGFVVLLPDHLEDLWHLYHIISKGDRVRASTIRKIEKNTNTGRVTERRRFNMTIAVEKVDFDTQGATIRLSGKNVSENEYVKLGQQHTWDSIHLKRLDDACDLSKSAEVGAIILDEGLAYVCLLTDHLTITKQKIEVTIPKKTYTATSHDKATIKFFEAVLASIEKNYDFNVIKCLIIASPGFVKDKFSDWLFRFAAQKEEHKHLMAHKSKFLLVHSNTGHREALTEVLQDPTVLQKLQNTKAAQEVKALEVFFNTLNINPDKAFYGFQDCVIANEHKAIDVLMITDELFRSAKIKERMQYVKLCEKVQENGGTVLIFSIAHVSGQQLQKLSGVCAILRFPVTIENDDIDESSTTDTESEESEDDELNKELEAKLEINDDLF
jgi:protein pelota